MFFFKKSKPVLKDLFTDYFIDIHNHLLPGIDDGSKSLDNTKELILSLKEIGFSDFITTPHVIDGLWNNSESRISETFTETANALKKENITAPIRTAAEYMMDYKFHENVKSVPLLTLKDKYLLVEMSYYNPPVQLYEIIFDIQLAGYTPVLAHPERYTFYEKNYNEYAKLKKAGCKFQTNLLSSVGYYGLDVLKIVDKLLADGMIDFAGSDVHHKHHVEGFSKKVAIKNVDALKIAIKNNAFFKETSTSKLSI